MLNLVTHKLMKSLRITIALITVVLFSQHVLLAKNNAQGTQCPQYLSAKSKHLPKFIFPADYKKIADRLKIEFGTHKVLPKRYELQCLIALSNYPELKKTHIKFVESKIRFTMQARPKIISSLFRNRKKRRYRIFINTDKKAKPPLLE